MGKKKSGKQTLVSVKDSGPEFMLEGRRPCLCEASRHPLVANCLSCGRIVCEQESAGPCFTCGTYVLTKADRDFLLSGSPEALARLEKLCQNGARIDFLDQIPGLNSGTKNRSLREIAASLSVGDQNLAKAIQHKDKLLEYDKNSVARSTVYDDQIDYFQLRNQNFVTGQNRQEIANRVDYIQENKFNRTDKIVLDLENLTVGDYQEPVIADLDEEHRKLEELSKIKSDYETKPSAHFIDGESGKKLPPPVYVPSLEPIASAPKNLKIPAHILSMEQYRKKIHDKDLDKIEDPGMALAVRQPYASLLVHGIKRFEGRAWYSPFRGRLWIYAALKQPSEEDISQVELLYRHIGFEQFPKNYPTGAMIGCVIVEDCLQNEVYREQYPECEVDDPYAFVCEYPIAFRRPLPVQKGGGKEIYKLDPQVHRACKGMLGF